MGATYSVQCHACGSKKERVTAFTIDQWLRRHEKDEHSTKAVRDRGPNPYCGAVPPKPYRQTAGCLLMEGHPGDHVNHIDKITWRAD